MAAQMAAMGSVGTLFAIVSRLANGTAQTEWKLYRKASTPDGERTPVTAHAALDLWQHPNRFYTTQELVETFEQHIELTGEGWLVIGRDPRSAIPLELWPVRPDRMTPVPSPTEYLTGYIYTGPDGEQVPLRVDEVIQLRMPNPMDPYRGMGPVQSILVDLDATRYSAEWNRNFFINSAQPGGILQVDRRLGDAEFDELRMRWNEQHRGTAAAHRVAILEQATWVDRRYTQQDMQFTELRAVSREVIREAFGFPKPLLGSVDDVNRANAEAGEVVFARWLLIPRLERIKQALNNDLLPLFGAAAKGLEFDYESPVPEDEEAENAELTAKSNAAAVLVTAGYDPAEVLAAVGLPPMAHTYPVAPVAPTMPAPTNGRPRAHHTRRLRLRDSADGDLEDVRADHEQALASLSTTWDGIEAGWIRDIEALVEDAVDSGDTTALASLSVSTDAAAGALQRALSTMAAQAASRLVQEAAAQGVHITAPIVDPAITNRTGPAAWRAVFGGELGDVATATTAILSAWMAGQAGREALRLYRPGATGRAVADGVGRFLRGLKGVFRRDTLGGALHRAQNVGRLAAIDAGPPDPVITATEVHDANCCEPCTAIDGTEFTSLDAAAAAYGTGGYIGCDGGIRCRGTVVAEWPPGAASS
jgi:HK97 family phage portal protein